MIQEFWIKITNILIYSAGCWVLKFKISIRAISLGCERLFCDVIKFLKCSNCATLCYKLSLRGIHFSER